MKFNLHFDLFNIIVIIFMIYVMFRLPSVEKMSNIDKATEDKIREIYKIDTDAIRNLSNLAKDLTVGGKLTVPGGLEIEGGLKVKGFTQQLGGGSVEGKLYYRHEGANGSDDTDPYFIEKVRTSADNNYLRLTINDNPNESFQIWGNSCSSEGGCGGHGKELFNFGANGNFTITGNTTTNNLIVNNNAEIKKQTTIHELYGGKSTWGGWRNIQVNGDHIMFDVGNKGYGFHTNGNMYYKVNDGYVPLNVNGGITANTVNTNTINLGGNRIRNLGDRIGFKNATSSGCCSNPDMAHKEFTIDFDAGAEHLRFWGKNGGRRIRGKWGRDADTW
jgi:hypothetical protein